MLDHAPEIDAHELVLFQSELAPEGARYTVLERFPFDGAGEDPRG
jgi:hypothetical protein